MIKLINCWMSALKGESLRHGSRKAVAMMRCADNKPCTKGAKMSFSGRSKNKNERSHCLPSSTKQNVQMFRQPSAEVSAVLIRNAPHSHQKKTINQTEKYSHAPQPPVVAARLFRLT